MFLDDQPSKFLQISNCNPRDAGNDVKKEASEVTTSIEGKTNFKKREKKTNVTGLGKGSTKQHATVVDIGASHAYTEGQEEGALVVFGDEDISQRREGVDLMHTGCGCGRPDEQGIG